MADLTKEQIAEYQRQQMAAFVERFNKFLEAEDFTVIAVPYIDRDGKISARIEVTPKLLRSFQSQLSLV